MQTKEISNEINSPSTPTFFQTEAQKQKNTSLPSEIARHKFHPYIANLNNSIDKALKQQSNAIFRQKKKLNEQLEMVKSQIEMKFEKSRKMEQYFRINCENILKKDINKWDDNKEFFIKLFQYYSQQLDSLKQANQKMRTQISDKKQKLKTIMRQDRHNYYQQKIKKVMEEKGILFEENQGSSTNQSIILKTYGKSTRVNTQISLPSLNKIQKNILLSAEISNIKTVNNKGNRLKTLESQPTERNPIAQRLNTQNDLKNQKKKHRYQQQEQSVEKNYLKPLLKTQIMIEKSNRNESSNKSHEGSRQFLGKSSNPSNIKSMILMLRWYKQQKYKKGNHNWFEKLVLIDRNFEKLQKYLGNLFKQGISKNRKFKNSNLDVSFNSDINSILNKSGRNEESDNKLSKKIFSQKKLKF